MFHHPHQISSRFHIPSDSMSSASPPASSWNHWVFFSVDFQSVVSNRVFIHIFPSFFENLLDGDEFQFFSPGYRERSLV